MVKGRLWRASNPALSADKRESLVRELMDARRAVGAALRQKKKDSAAEKEARAGVHAAKVALGERGPVWWDDGEPDYNRYMLKNTPYAGLMDHAQST